LKNILGRLFPPYDKGIKAKKDNHMLGDNMKTLRKRKGYSQETLAEQLHVARQTISKWEKGTGFPGKTVGSERDIAKGATLKRVLNVYLTV
jgi:DNA-binding XRE family transcriptional regulator